MTATIDVTYRTYEVELREERLVLEGVLSPTRRADEKEPPSG